MIEFNITRGRVGEVLPTIQNKLNGYLSRYGRIKIGATSNPDVRWKEHALGGWRKMVLLYESKWPGSTRSMEKKLIEYARSANFIVDPENKLPGGESIADHHGQYWVYAIVA